MGINKKKNVMLVIYEFHNIKANMLAMFNHSLGIKINNNIINVNILIVIVKQLDSTMLEKLNLIAK